MKQITAVECLKINLDKELKSRGVSVKWDTYLRMEKEQIIDAREDGIKEAYGDYIDIESGRDSKMITSEQYYNKTYKTNEQ